MNYLLDKKIKQKKFIKLIISAVILFIFIYFNSGIFRGFSVVAHFVFRPVLISGNYIGDRFSNINSFFASKKSLFLENEKLKSEIDQMSARVSNYNSLLDENNKLKEILGRLPAQAGKNEKSSMLLANILSKPNQSAYDTLLIDVGSQKGVRVGDTVFALGNIPIGRIDTTYGSSAKVVLFSSPEERIEVIIPGGDIFAETIGRGGGNFEMSLPRDITLEKGAEMILPGADSYLLGVVEKVISDPRDSFQKVLLVSPVNIQELRFVQVEQ